MNYKLLYLGKYNNCVYLLKEIIFSNYIGCLLKENLLINIGV